MSRELSLQLIQRAFGALAIGFVGVLLARQIEVESPVKPVPPPPLSLPEGQYLPDEVNNIEVFRRVSPSVVHISSVALQRSFFSFNTYEIPQGLGTGFVWDREGHIVTNLHVIQQADRVTVRTIDQKVYNATFVGGDANKDLAVLKIDAPRRELFPVEVLPEGASVLVGQKTIAIGNPFGLDHTLTTGVVSALEREMEALSGFKIFGVIQTDAAINPGNSGGPLLNAHGQLIGVNTMIFSGSGSSAGIGFAVPATVVSYVVPQLIEHGRVTRVGLGVLLLDDHLARRLGVVEGVVVRQVFEGTAAAEAGLQGIRIEGGDEIRLGHVITAVDDRPVQTRKDLLDMLLNYRRGDQVKLGVLLGRERSELVCRLQDLE